MNQVLGSITILVSDRQANVAGLNELLTESGHLINARMGVNVEKRCVSQCPGLIVLAVEAEKDRIDELVEKIRALKGIKVESVVFGE
ncbi:MAG TPA: hypothetical protein PKI61_04240 [bacterium]|nr:hypothetical protein [bacterium]HPT29614.1 hypothetical protein [bacterium]